MKDELKALRNQVEEVQRQLNLILDKIDVLDKMVTQGQVSDSSESFSNVIDFSRPLRTIPDFPQYRTIHLAIINALIRKDSSYESKLGWKWATVDDLLKLSESELLESHSIGKVRLKIITDWMESNGLEFYYMKKSIKIV